MPTIRPMADLRDTGKISELCYQKDEPIFITKNGSGHLVVMSMDTYEKRMGLLDVYRKLGDAEKQLAEGVPLLTGNEVFSKLRKSMESNYSQIQYTPLAYENLDEIDTYISEVLMDPQAAEALLEEIEETIRQLEQFPYIGAEVNDSYLAAKGYRKLTVQNYLIFYLVNSEQGQIVIMRIFYGVCEFHNLL